MRKAILNLGNGNLQQGCGSVALQLLQPGKTHPIQRTASLPPAPSLGDLYKHWQQLYLIRNENQFFRIHISHSTGLRYSETKFKAICKALTQQLNDWLNSDTFRSIDQELRTAFSRDEEFQIILTTNNEQLHRLPWHLWQFLEDYPKAEIALSKLDWQELPALQSASDTCKLLALLGDSRGIDIATDYAILRELPNIQLTLLQDSNHREFNEHLWDAHGWDILYFAGHSQTEGKEGQIQISAAESLTIPQLKHALRKAIANGLQLAIFNSCDGIGLAHQLADLNIPYTIVMREPVPDQVAQRFLQSFCQAASAGVALPLAVREARQKLETLESETPCASWLPVIWQNPTANPFHWASLPGSEKRVPVSQPPRPSAHPRLSWQRVVTLGLAMTGLVMGVRSLGFLEPVELATYDTVVRQRPPEPVDRRILVVEVTQEDTNRYGYPLPDDTIIQLVQKLQQHQPHAIGLDMHRSQPRLKNPGHQTLSQYFEQSKTLFLVCSYSSQDKSYEPPPVSSQEKMHNQVGFSDLLVDSSPLIRQNIRSDLEVEEQSVLETLTVRRQLLSYDPGLLQVSPRCSTPYSLSFQIAFQFFVAKNVKPLEVNSNLDWQFGTVAFPSLPTRFGGYQQLDGTGSQVMLNYRSNQPGRRVSLSQVLEGQIDPRFVQNNVVLIGYTAPVARDFFNTPYGPMEGVWIHAHMLSQTISAVLDKRPLIWTLPQWRSLQWGDTLWSLGWGIIGGFIAWSLSTRSRLYLVVAIAVACWILYQLSGMAILYGLWIPLVPTALTLLTTAGLVVMHRVSR